MWRPMVSILILSRKKEEKKPIHETNREKKKTNLNWNLHPTPTHLPLFFENFEKILIPIWKMSKIIEKFARAQVRARKLGKKNKNPIHKTNRKKNQSANPIERKKTNLNWNLHPPLPLKKIFKWKQKIWRKKCQKIRNANVLTKKIRNQVEILFTQRYEMIR